MPTSKIFLADVNVWLAIVSRRHVHVRLCCTWFDSLRSRSVNFCRVTQMGLLRLLTNQSAMGKDVLTSREAWCVYDVILSDERVSFSLEPFSLEPLWKELTDRARRTAKVWTDAYLAAFAETAGTQLVTLDRAILALAPGALLLS